MNKSRKLKVFSMVGLVSILIVALIFLGMNVVQAQNKSKGKPPGKGKPPKEECNNNGICEAGEPDTCADCQNLSALNTEGKQIVTAGDENRVYQIKYRNGIHQNTWVSNLIDGNTSGVCIGDVENDGAKEIIATSIKKVKGKNRWQLNMYKNGSWGEPYYSSPILGRVNMFKIDSEIADADNNVGNGNELLIALGYHFEIYRWIGNEFVKIWQSTKYNGGIWSVDVGDADNDGQNEIVLAAFQTPAPIVLEYLGNDTWGDEQLIDPVDINCMDIARVRDSDNLMDGSYDNEIIAGGCNSRLMVWKYNKNSSYYESVFTSEPLYNYTQGVGAGDIDFDDENEVIVGTEGDDGLIYIFEYKEGTYSISSSWLGGGCSYLSVGNLDNDPEDEIALGYKDGIKIFDYDYARGQLNLTFHFPCGKYLEIK